MDDSNFTTPPLEAAAGTAGPRAIEAFWVLGDETRLSILPAFREAYEPWARGNAIPFSELRERLGRPDSGSFNYHVDKLTGQFIRRTDEGYELRRAGLELVRTVITTDIVAEDDAVAAFSTMSATHDGGEFTEIPATSK